MAIYSDKITAKELSEMLKIIESTFPDIVNWLVQIALSWGSEYFYLGKLIKS